MQVLIDCVRRKETRRQEGSDELKELDGETKRRWQDRFLWRKRNERFYWVAILTIYRVDELVDTHHESSSSRTSRAHRIVFFVSSGMRCLARNSEAIQFANKSCLICPSEKQSARSPIIPYESLMMASVRSSSMTQRFTSSRMLGT